ncbi:MAG: hypothetical protein AB7V42_13910 [Thermoleophilia bacterium]
MALVVALLTLQSPDVGPEPTLPPTIDGQATAALQGELAGVAPERAPGSAEDQAAAKWVLGQLQQIPGATGKVQTQDLVARADGAAVNLQNIYLAVPGSVGASRRPGIVVIAPRDTPPGVAAGSSSTAVLLSLARYSASSRHERPHLFVSTDGSTLGNAGVRWFLTRFSGFPLAAAIVLDAPGEATGDRFHIWTDGRADRQAIRLGAIAERSVEAVGGRTAGAPSLTGQMLRMAVPQTFGEQGAVIAAGLPAVTLSGRAESPLRPGAEVTAERLQLAASAANHLLGALDAAPTVPAPDQGVEFAGKILRPTVSRIALLLLALPVLVLAVDAVAALRRARVRMVPALRTVGLRSIPLFAALIAAHLLSLAGLLPREAGGAPPLPGDARFGAAAGLGLVLAVGAGLLAWLWARRRIEGHGAPPAAEGVAALGALAVLMVVLWLASPFALVLALPVAHAALIASVARRGWQLVALAAVAALPVLLLLLSLAGRLDSNIVFAGWYLLATAASGARGATGLVLAVLVLACVWSIGSLLSFRARKLGLAAGPLSPAHPGRREARARLRLRVRVERRPRPARRRGRPGG